MTKQKDSKGVVSAEETLQGEHRKVYLLGNPNCGKTSLFNAITGERLHVGNWPGVTVSRIEGRKDVDGKILSFVDLPGAYSLTPASPEEKIVLQNMGLAWNEQVLNVVDASNLNRNLLLTAQLLEIGIRPVIALNCFDSFSAMGGTIDLKLFSNMTGCEVFPTVGRTGDGTVVLSEYLAQGKTAALPSEERTCLSLPEEWQKAAEKVLLLNGGKSWAASEPLARYDSIVKLTGRDTSDEKLTLVRRELAEDLSKTLNREVREDNLASELAADRYRRIGCVISATSQVPEKQMTPLHEKLDDVLTHRFWGFPIFLLIMALVFWTTFSIGNIPMEWIENSFAWLAEFFKNVLPKGLLADLFVEGLINGVGSVVVFLPNILILFFWIALLEDSGYMSRAAFMVDRLMEGMGLHGRAFIPMIMGVGCNVPAVMATRILDDKFQLYLSMFLIPFVTCSARLPVLVLLSGIFFPQNPALCMFTLFAINILVMVLLGHFIHIFAEAKSPAPFMLEMPPYRFPTPKSLWNLLKDKALDFLVKAGTVVLAGTVVIWVLQAFPRQVPLSFDYKAEVAAYEQTLDGEELSSAIQELEQRKTIEELEGRYIAKIGKFFQPVMAPLGFTWRETVSLIPGFLAKETVVSVLNILYMPMSSPADSEELSPEAEQAQVTDLGDAMRKNGITPLKAFVFMLFTLLYIPCIATVGVVWRESGSAAFTLLTLLCYFMIAYGVSFATLKIGQADPTFNELGVIFLGLLALAFILSKLVRAIKGSGRPGAACSGNCSACHAVCAPSEDELN